MSSFERDAALDQKFERALIESARADALPAAATNAAWVRFAAGLTGTSALAQAAGQRVELAADGGRRGARRLAIKWLAIGAIGGASLTAVALTAQRERSVANVLPATAEARPASSLPVARDDRRPVLPTIESAAPAGSALAAPTPPAANALARSRPERRPRRPPIAAAPGPDTTPAATLAAEVSLLDAALSANASGAYDGGLRLIRDYHRRFPSGELSIDADVIALDALAGQRADARVTAEAERFLARYPNDPHAAHVRQLLRERSR